jgi:hypothetical protein
VTETLKMDPIYDCPGHMFYGPVRRLHLKLMELFGDDLAEVEAAYELNIRYGGWTFVMASSLSQGVGEAHVARSILKTMLHLLDTIQCQRAADRVAYFKGPCRS